MTDIVESLEHLARLKSLSEQAGHARMAMNFAAAEIARLRAALEDIRQEAFRDGCRMPHIKRVIALRISDVGDGQATNKER